MARKSMHQKNTIWAQLLTRRNLLKIGGAALAIAAVPTAVYFAHDHKNWDFLSVDINAIERQYRGERFTPDDPGHYIRLDEGKEVRDHTRVWQKTREKTEQQIKDFLDDSVSAGKLPGTVYSVKVTSESWGAPDNPILAEAVREYCIAAEDFLHSHLKGLDSRRVNWTVVKPNRSYSQGSNGRGFIVNRTFYVNRANLYNKDNGVVIESFPFIDGPYFGATSGLFGDSVEQPSFRVIIPCNPYALVAPFSEIIPISTYRSTIAYSAQVGLENALKADEALSEALADSLAERLCREEDIPDGPRLIRSLWNKVASTPRYSLVPEAKKWIRKNGEQNALDIYLNEGAAKFVSKITGN